MIRLRYLIAAILTVAVISPKVASAQDLFTQKTDPLLNPVKLVEDHQKKLEEEKKQKAEEERLAQLRATQPWLFRPSGGPNTFYRCQCTFYAKMKRPDVNWRGNANVWDTNAARNGFTVLTTPAVGTIAVFRSYTHVAIVEAVNGSKVLISEWNYDGPCVTSTRWISIGEAVYIY